MDRSNSVYKVWLLGKIRIENNNGRLHIPTGNIQTLLVYLLLHPDAEHSREHLIELLWSDTPTQPGRRRLSNLLYRFQKSLGRDWLHIEKEHISLQKDKIWADVWAFNQYQKSQIREDLNQAVNLYHGDLAPEIYADWIMLNRAHLREQYLAALSQLAHMAEKAGDLNTAVAHYQRLALHDPLNETAVANLMRLYNRLGEPHTAVTHYQTLQNALATELNTTPLPKTQALFRAIQAQTHLHLAKTPRPFVGRAQERSHLLSLLAQAHESNGRMALILGEAGIGKTRLLAEIEQSAQWRGWQTSWGSTQEFTLPAAFAPLQLALQTLCPPTRLRQLAQRMPPYWLANLLPLLPQLNTVLDLSLPEPHRKQLAPALGHLFHNLGQVAPHLILLDDMQWADPELWTLLQELQPHLADAAVFLLLNGRTEELRTQPHIWQTITTWDQQNIPILHLSGLSRTDLQTLVKTRLSPAKTDDLMQASGGNPLLALTLLETDTLDTPAPLPTLLRQRLKHLSTPAQLALQAAAVIGQSFDYNLWQAVVTAVPAADLPFLAGELEQANILHLTNDGYQFAHDTLHACVYNDTPIPRRRNLHQRTLNQLKQTNSSETLFLLYHAQQAEDQPATAHYALRAGEQALNSLSYKKALHYFSLTLDNLDPADWQNLIQATRGRIKVCATLGEREHLAKDTLALLNLTAQMNNSQLYAEAAYYRADYLWLIGQQDEAKTQAQTGLEVAQQAGDAATQAMLLLSLSRIAHHQGDFEQAISWLEMAKAQFDALGDAFGQADALDKLANLTYQSGHYQQAAKLHQEAAAAFKRLDNPLKEARALNGFGLAVRAQGDYAQARQIHEQALRIGQQLADAELQWVQLVNLGNIAYELGDSATAVTHYQAAIHLIRQINNAYALALTSLNLGEMLLGQGEINQARQHYTEALTLNQQHGYQRGVALAQHGLGLTWLEDKNPPKAQKSLSTAQALWQELNQPLKLMETEAALAQTHLLAGAHEKAKTHCQTAVNLLGDGQTHTVGWRWVHYTAYLVFADTPAKSLHHLCQAATAVQTQAHSLPPDRQQAFLQKVPLNQKIMTAVAQHSQQQPQRLVRADVPLGRKLSADDYINITWTVHSPLDEMIANPLQRRRAILKRLLNEAAAQAAAPTDDDLAMALAVSRRTIERDMAALKAEGIISPTRRRK